MAFDAYIFDLDGTLLDTLPDLVRLTNMVLRDCGWPERSRQEVLSYVGDGGLALLRRAAPVAASDREVRKAFALWEDYYPIYGHGSTKPYSGISATLRSLRDRGAKLGVLSNKFDAAVKDVIGQHFPNTFAIVQGECEGVPRKPDPSGLRGMLLQLGVSPQRVAYVGDSVTDIQVAKRVGAFAVGVSWGYQPAQGLRVEGADAIIDEPSRLLSL